MTSTAYSWAFTPRVEPSGRVVFTILRKLTLGLPAWMVPACVDGSDPSAGRHHWWMRSLPVTTAWAHVAVSLKSAVGRPRPKGEEW